MMRKTILAAVVMGIGLLARGAMADVTEPFADVNNDGRFGPGDVPIGKVLSGTGVFDTSKAVGAYQPTGGPVGVVFPARFVVRGRVLVVKASGDISVHGSLGAPGRGGAILLISTGGTVRIDDGLRLSTDSVLQVVAGGDVSVGKGVQLVAKSNSYGMVAVASQSGSVAVGANASLSAQGLVELLTNDVTGAGIDVGTGARLSSSGGSARVTAGGDVDLDGVRVAGQDVVIGSHASTAAASRAADGAGYTCVRNSIVRAPHGMVHLFASGTGGIIDVTKSALQASSADNVVLDATVIVR